MSEAEYMDSYRKQREAESKAIDEAESLMEPQTQIHVPESARKDKTHQHEWHLYHLLTGKIVAICQRPAACTGELGSDEIERRLNALEDMLTWKDGIYTGTQMRDFARIVCDPASIGS